jgi:hypothetical protein
MGLEAEQDAQGDGDGDGQQRSVDEDADRHRGCPDSTRQQTNERSNREQTKDVTSVFAAAAAEVQRASVVERDPNGFVKPLDIGMEG